MPNRAWEHTPPHADSDQMEDRRQREDTWPGDRVPAKSDAEIAYRPLDPRLVSVFKQAMLADSHAREQVQLLSPENGQALLGQAASGDVLPWPLALFSASLPPSPALQLELDGLVQACDELFLRRSPFVKHVPSNVFLRVPRPEYLTLAMAAMGALLTQQPEERSLHLWNTSASQLLGTLDVDNSLARKTDLVKAWILLETFGFLSSDPAMRRRTRMLHGCVKTAVWRILREAPYFVQSGVAASGQNPGTNHGRSIVSYFLLIDLLRSIQHDRTTSFPTPVFLAPNQYRSPTEENFDPDKALAGIIPLLADAHLITSVFDPLAIQSALPPPFPSKSHHIPFTPGHEIKRLRQKLLTSLLEWKEIHLNSAPKDVLLLYHLCRLASLAPSLRSLFRLSGYLKPTLGSSARRKELERASQAVPEYSAANSTAWNILEIRPMQMVLVTPSPAEH